MSRATRDRESTQSAGANPPQANNDGSSKEEPPYNPPPLEIPKDEQAKRVVVICEGTLGPELLEKGDITDDPDYVALLETERGRTLVRAVK